MSCILIALPQTMDLIDGVNVRDSKIHVSDEWNSTSIDGGDSIGVVVVNSRLQHATLMEYVRLSNTERFSGDICRDVIGVVGDLDTMTASIILSLSSQFYRNITLIASVAPSSFLPVSSLSLSHVFDMKPLSHYIEGIVRFIQYWNWTRVGVIADDTSYYHFAAERFPLTGLNKTATPYNYTDEWAARVLYEIQEFRTHIFVILIDGRISCL